jgi:hypothetical protein
MRPMNDPEVGKIYMTSVHRALKPLRATWWPGDRIELGAVGVLLDGAFHQRTTLKKLGVGFGVRTTKTNVPFDYSSSRGVSVSAKAAGSTSSVFSAVGKASAGVHIAFGRAGAVVLSAPDSTVVEIEEIRSLERQLNTLRSSGIWEGDWVFIKKTVMASTATILVAGANSASVELEAKADLGQAGVDLARIGVGYKLASHSGMAVKMVAERGLVPLYEADRLVWRPTVANLGRRVARPRRRAVRKAAPRKATARKKTGTTRVKS